MRISALDLGNRFKIRYATLKYFINPRVTI